MTRPTRGVLLTSPPSPEDTTHVRDLPPAIAGTLEKEAKRLEDEPEPETERIEPDQPDADPTPTTSLSSGPTYSSLTGAHADD
ncbi:hypothetical protein [Natronosalvus rutilus]|uniref:Uncharacterized protein n=1 Tax=Natronosalvus rutilus TaxID=2953753 RepID=A0A9E7NBH4_9EURY|nr:hypothetical protein [Natronosalvus rutilus]UTF53944.1 hypothetical protein NGM29_01270 [Natronosalvus rutilus]